MKKLFPVIALLVLSIGCGGGKTQYLDANKAEGSKEFGPKEIKMTVNTMVESMTKFLKEEWKKPSYLQVKKFLNKTSEHIDTSMISNEIQTNLLKRRIKFIDDQLTEDALKEIERGMTGMVDPDSAVPAGALKSPNLYLTGDIRDNVRTVGGKEIQYLVVTLKLVNLKTSEVEWQEQQEFLKSSKKTKVSF
ncbi:MAG TPA: penicillin-binding protein activator LpoB [Spirochaetota bacterium]|nr:penicillin-binding protein activator LpoB [Spirochaetota bacterium]